MPDLQTPTQLIHALGGASQVATLTGRSVKAVSNWHKRGIPRDFGTVVAVRDALRSKGLSIPSWLPSERTPAQ